jgi:retron-type reverse transcriptase
LEKHFHPDSYGYRPGKSALDAVGMARQRCWKNDWVLDIKGFFDNIDHELMMRAVGAHTEEKWVLLYIERWLKARLKCLMGPVNSRRKGRHKADYAKHCIIRLMHSNSLCKVNGFDARF